MYKVDYKKSKELTFKQLYGGVFKQYKDLEFFKKIQKFIDILWEEFNTQGYIECPISKYRFEKDKLDNMNPQKLFNYLLQALETAHHVGILWKIFKLLRGKNTKIILYVYDAIILDLDEGENILGDIVGVYRKYGVNVKIKGGDNYQNLTEFGNP
jgi:hypothetical protein